MPDEREMLVAAFRNWEPMDQLRALSELFEYVSDADRRNSLFAALNRFNPAATELSRREMSRIVKPGIQPPSVSQASQHRPVLAVKCPHCSSDLICQSCRAAVAVH